MDYSITEDGPPYVIVAARGFPQFLNVTVRLNKQGSVTCGAVNADDGVKAPSADRVGRFGKDASFETVEEGLYNYRVYLEGTIDWFDFITPGKGYDVYCWAKSHEPFCTNVTIDNFDVQTRTGVFSGELGTETCC